MLDPTDHVAELARWQKAKRAMLALTKLPLATKQKVVYPELVRVTALTLGPSPSYAAAEVYLRILLAEMAEDDGLAAYLFDAMNGPPPRHEHGLVGLFRAFVTSARDPRGLRLVELANGLDWERVVLAVDGQRETDKLVDLLEHPPMDVYFHGVPAALYAGPRARSGLHALFERTFSTSQQWVAVAIAVARDPAAAAWFRSLPTQGAYANAKRLHLALTSCEPKQRIDAIDKITNTVSGATGTGVLVGLCLALDDGVPEVVERAAAALAKHSRNGQEREIEHHAIFMRLARAAVERGVTAAARKGLEVVATKIPRATPLPPGTVVEGALGKVPVRAARPRKPVGRSPHASVTSTNDDLVRAILASPDDDAPRLVLADRLLDRGDPRGEFIQIQCALGRLIEGVTGRVPRIYGATAEDWVWLERAAYTPLDPPNRAELEAREAQLYKKHVKHWLEPVRPFVRTWSWRRGFLCNVNAPAAAFLEGASTLLAAHPLAVALEKMDRATLERLQDAPLAGLRGLAVSKLGNKVGSAFLGENLKSLEKLVIEDTPLAGEGLARLANESHLGSLRRLALTSNNLGDADLRTISASPILQKLEILDLRNNGAITNAGLCALIESPRLPHLRHLHLSAGFDPETHAALARRLTKARAGV